MKHLYRLLSFCLILIQLQNFNLMAQPEEWVFDLNAGTSAECPGNELYSVERPDSEGESSKVSIGLYFNDILEIRDTEQTITADIWMAMRWRDERLADPERGKTYAECNLSPDEVWMPDFQIRDIRDIEQYYPDFYLIDAEGHIVLLKRLMVTVFSALDLREFPFDRQTLNLGIDSIKGTGEIEFEVWKELVGFAKEPSVASWILSPPKAEAVPVYGKIRQSDYSAFNVRIEAKREPGFFTRKLIIPVALIVFMAYAIFWIKPSMIAPQMGVGATSMLTLIAYHFALGNFLPRISYLTRADTFLLLSLLLVFTALMEAATTAALESYGKIDLIHKIDKIFRICYPLAFILIVVYAVF